MTSPSITTAAGMPRPPWHAAAALAALGWDLIAAEVDLVAGTLRVELRRDDGLTATLDRDTLGRTSLTRDRAVRHEETVGRRGDRCRVERIRREFVGRDRICGGVRDALRALANYVGDNAAAPNRRLGRAAIALLLEPIGRDQLVPAGAGERLGQLDAGGGEDVAGHEITMCSAAVGVTENRCADGSQRFAEVA